MGKLKFNYSEGVLQGLSLDGSTTFLPLLVHFLIVILREGTNRGRFPLTSLEK